jgi:hypothetical protein
MKAKVWSVQGSQLPTRHLAWKRLWRPQGPIWHHFFPVETVQRLKSPAFLAAGEVAYRRTLAHKAIAGSFLTN